MTKLTKKQEKNIKAKNTPFADKEYLITDDCFWQQNPPKNYNVLDPKRTPHFITVVDVKTGSVVRLHSGSIIKVIHPAQ